MIGVRDLLKIDKTQKLLTRLARARNCKFTIAFYAYINQCTFVKIDILFFSSVYRCQLRTSAGAFFNINAVYDFGKFFIGGMRFATVKSNRNNLIFFEDY